jgi:hypothetical protein
LLQGLHDEVALMHEGMGNLEVGLVDGETVVEQDVDVDDAVVIDVIGGLPGAPHLSLYLLGELQYLARRKRCMAAYGGIKEGMLRLEPPGLGNEESRLAHNGANQLLYSPASFKHVGLAVTQIGAQTKVDGMRALSVQNFPDSA